jgi:hypothetical protein
MVTRSRPAKVRQPKSGHLRVGAGQADRTSLLEQPSLRLTPTPVPIDPRRLAPAGEHPYRQVDAEEQLASRDSCFHCVWNVFGRCLLVESSQTESARTKRQQPHTPTARSESERIQLGEASTPEHTPHAPAFRRCQADGGLPHRTPTCFTCSSAAASVPSNSASRSFQSQHVIRQTPETLRGELSQLPSRWNDPLASASPRGTLGIRPESQFSRVFLQKRQHSPHRFIPPALDFRSLAATASRELNLSWHHFNPLAIGFLSGWSFVGFTCRLVAHVPASQHRNKQPPPFLRIVCAGPWKNKCKANVPNALR